MDNWETVGFPPLPDSITAVFHGYAPVLHRFEHSPFRWADCQPRKPCQSDHEAKANRLLLPAKQGAFGFRKAPRGREETQAQSEPQGGEEGGDGNGAEGRNGGAECRKALKRTKWSRESVGLSKFSERAAPGASSRQRGHWMEVRRIGQAEDRASGETHGRASRGCWKLRPLPGLARGSGRKPQTEGRFLSRLGPGRLRKRRSVGVRSLVNRLIRPPEIGLAPIFCV